MDVCICLCCELPMCTVRDCTIMSVSSSVSTFHGCVCVSESCATKVPGDRVRANVPYLPRADQPNTQDLCLFWVYYSMGRPGLFYVIVQASVGRCCL